MDKVLLVLLSLGIIGSPTLVFGAGSVTGSWASHGSVESGGLWLKTIQIGKKVQFQLEISRGAPSYNSGFIEGKFNLHSGQGIFKLKSNQDESSDCEINFSFSPSKVVITESTETDMHQSCGFGYNVHAYGTLFIKSREKPKFSQGDPRN